MKLALNYMGPFTFSSFRFFTGTLTMFVILSFTKQVSPPKTYMIDLIIIGIFQTTIVFLLVMYGLLFVDAGKSSILLYSMPMWSTLLSVKFLHERLTLAKAIGLLIGMLGLLTILGWDLWMRQSLQTMIGEVLIIVAAISWSIANIYYRRRMKNIPLIQVSAWQMLFGTVGIVLATFVTEMGEPIDLQMTSITYILFVGIFASALCFTAWFLILNVIDIVTATISTLLVPIFSLVLSYIILREQLTSGIIIGSMLIISGIIIAQKGVLKKQ